MLRTPTGLWAPNSSILALALVFAFAGCLVQAHADIISSCGNTSVLEGDSGLVMCTVVNLGADPVNITGVFAFAEPIAGDFSDTIVSVDVLGPYPNGGNPVIFEVFFDTTPADPPDELPLDVGLNDVSLILYAEDAITNDFVPGLYGSAAVAVFDVGLTPMDPVDEGGTIIIDDPDDYYDTMDYVKDRGYVSNTPEPASILMVATGAAGLLRLARRRRG